MANSERRVSDLKRRSDDLRSELETANAELESAEASKKASDQGLKVSQTERDLVLASIQPQEARIALLQNEISAVQSAVAKIKR
ncbi:hypothetical protein QJS10_CPA10g01709 [Acorus calamus]|uniref:Uncharacterized protein n=1 Tax=Acorus calamus TaxID=4465 RepID=A0AAV9DYR5_ACOCL|nr:hypothetical protein QJS10_CPA10g01709 [Acorus calamus]